MADVEMPDAGPSAPPKSKASAGKSAKSGGAEVGPEGRKRFEVKKWNAVALWAWDIVVDNCAICRNHIMDLCMLCSNTVAGSLTNNSTQVLNVKQIKLQLPAKNVQWRGVFVT